MRLWTTRAGLLAALLIGAGACCQAQTLPPSAQELVREAVENELDPTNSQTRFMFRDDKKTPSGSQTKIYVQTSEAMAGLVVAYNGQPLSAEQQRGEIWRVKRVLKDPDEMKKKQKQEKEDEERYKRIIKALPDAFLYEYDGTETGSVEVGRPGVTLIRLKFQPNPKYDPPTRVEQVLTGMEGHVLIDSKRRRAGLIEGTLVKDVSFGWGILGHLDRGGHILIEQADVWEGQWRITHMDLSFTGKIFFFKSINVQSSETSSDFRPVPADLTYAQGVEMLKQQQATIAEDLRRSTGPR
jgi:hypothetical protein